MPSPSWSIGAVDMPVVRLTERKKPLITREPGLWPDITPLHSARMKTSMPRTSRPPMPQRTTRVSSVQRRRPRGRSKMVRKERLPTSAAMPITTTG